MADQSPCFFDSPILGDQSPRLFDLPKLANQSPAFCSPIPATKTPCHSPSFESNIFPDILHFRWIHPHGQTSHFRSIRHEPLRLPHPEHPANLTEPSSVRFGLVGVVTLPETPSPYSPESHVRNLSSSQLAPCQSNAPAVRYVRPVHTTLSPYSSALTPLRLVVANCLVRSHSISSISAFFAHHSSTR